MTQLTPEEITDSIYKAYGTDSGILFGIKERDIVKAIVEFTVNRLEAQLKQEKKIVSDLLDQLDDTKKLLYEERERSKKLLDELRGAIESMIYQYGYRTVYDGQPAIGTGGMSALEHAFDVMGWGDPHIIPEDGNTCEIQGCMQDPSSGQRWGDLYLSLCSDHSRMLREGKDRPDVKDYAIKREATRDKVTGFLP